MTCEDALLVAVTGGGEGGVDDPGTTLGALTAPLASEVAATGRTLTTRVVHAETLRPASLQGRGTKRTDAEKAVTRKAWNTWRAPVPTLVSGLEAALAETLPACPDQLLYLAGYSQGAEAVHRYLATRADADVRSRSVAVVLVADPARVSGSAGPIAGDPHASRRAEGVSARLARKPLPAVPAGDWRGPIHSVCTAGDVGCDLGADPVPRRPARPRHLRHRLRRPARQPRHDVRRADRAVAAAGGRPGGHRPGRDAAQRAARPSTSPRSDATTCGSTPRPRCLPG